MTVPSSWKPPWHSADLQPAVDRWLGQPAEAPPPLCDHCEEEAVTFLCRRHRPPEPEETP